MSERYFSNRADLTHVKGLDKKGYPPGHPEYLKIRDFIVKVSASDAGYVLSGWDSRDGSRFLEAVGSVRDSEIQEFLDNPELGIKIHSALELSESQVKEMMAQTLGGKI